MNNSEIILVILILSLALILCRALPFIIFRKKQKLPRFIDYLGKTLPTAMTGLLCVYCFKDYDFSSFVKILPAFIATIITIMVHLIKKSMILSIMVGTTIYMILIRVI